MKPITMKHLRYFEALARHGHFGRAAERVSVSQPALSAQIRELEEALGCPVYDEFALYQQAEERSKRRCGLL